MQPRARCSHAHGAAARTAQPRARRSHAHYRRRRRHRALESMGKGMAKYITPAQPPQKISLAMGRSVVLWPAGVRERLAIS